MKEEKTDEEKYKEFQSEESLKHYADKKLKEFQKDKTKTRIGLVLPKSEEELKKKLTKKQYHILRERGTELPFTSELLKNKERGMYACAACGSALFSSHAKFDSGTGWPSFDKPANTKNIELKEDFSQGMRRVEVLCKTCKSHLGHVFNDGPTRTKERYCINGCALAFKKQ